MEFEKIERTVFSYKQMDETEKGLEIQQPLRVAPSQEIFVKHTVVDTYEREALRLLLDRGYVVYKINGGKATLD